MPLPLAAYLSHIGLGEVADVQLTQIGYCNTTYTQIPFLQCTNGYRDKSLWHEVIFHPDDAEAVVVVENSEG